ncbi:MAG: hypothetical protein CVU14_00145 [Bacteroidetes bacterium HGW-Bacteroidetes-9]|nr:MAG: hypothetical protein CVU14_00145 [Bacteroidetes bacterium HGW-Bacteroidetes-9]
MKQFAAIIITLIVCFNTVGYFFVFKVKELQVKSEVKKLIRNSVPEDQLVQIRLSSDNEVDFKWIHSKEFWYKGIMYDVVRFKVVSVNVIDYYCFEDKKETGLNDRLNSIVREMMNGNNHFAKVNNLFFGFFAGLFPPVHNAAQFYSVEKPVLYCFYVSYYSYLHLSVIPHPPNS